MITGFQFRAAKGVLNLQMKNIALAIGVHQETVIQWSARTANFDFLPCNVRKINAIEQYFNTYNITFHKDNGMSLQDNQYRFSNNQLTMTRFQLKAARIALKMTQKELAFYIKVSPAAISRLEMLKNKEYIKSLRLDTYKLRYSFEKTGIFFPNDLYIFLLKDPKFVF